MIAIRKRGQQPVCFLVHLGFHQPRTHPFGSKVHSRRPQSYRTFASFLPSSWQKYEISTSRVASVAHVEGFSMLIIDDDVVLLEAIRRTLALRLPEIHVDISPSAQEALGLLATQPYDLALCDVRMPVMDGHQFLIEAQRLYPGMPVLIMSGHTDESEMR